MIIKSMKIEQAVKERPNIVEILSENNIDFCCGGWEVLEDAVARQGLNVDEFVEKLNNYETKGDVNDWRLALDLGKNDLMRYIVNHHHRDEEALLEEVDRLLAKILYVHYETHGDSLTKIYQLFLKMKGELAPHFAQEEQIDFPKAMNGEVDWQHLRDDHDAVGEMLRELQELTNEFTPPADACNTYVHAFKKLHDLVDDIHLHVFLENSVLFER